MENISPTRMNLLLRRNQVSLAHQGVELLKRKRDALIADFFQMVRQAMDKRKWLEALSREAYLYLSLSEAYSGPDLLKVLGNLGKREIAVEIQTKNIWGVKVPEINSPPIKRSIFERGWNPQWQSVYTIRTAHCFENLIENLLDIAGDEIKIRKMGMEIKKVTRRVNALEQVVIPRLRNEISFIKSVLEQREREDIFRLKRLKQKRAEA